MSTTSMPIRGVARHRTTLVVAVGVLLLDLASKLAAHRWLAACERARSCHVSRQIGEAGLARTSNAGSAFGAGQGNLVWVALAAFGAASAVMFALLLQSSRMSVIAVGLIAGAASANLVERLTEGSVTDFILIGSPTSGMFLNLADVALLSGALALSALITLNRKERRTS